MNVSPNQDMSAVYLRYLHLREAAEASIVPSEKADALQEAVDLGNQMVERLALLGAALNANFIALEKKIQDLETKHPELVAQLDKEIGGLIGLRKAFLGFYDDEAKFCANFEKMVRDKMLQEAGIDPNNQEAVMAYLLKKGKEMTPSPEKN